jgi:hypothetical protein
MNIQFEQMTSERLYPIGYKFELKRGKASAKTYEIINYVFEHNFAGNLTSFKYVCAYDFCGQRMTENFVQTTIDIATNNDWKNLTSKAA